MFAAIVFTKADAPQPQVETPFGPVKGFIHKTKEGKEVNVFLGIRYGKAPDHIFRFEVVVL